MIVNNLYVRWPRRSVLPIKTDPPLLVYTDAALSLPITRQYFESVAGQDGKVLDRRRRLQAVEL